MNKPSQPSNSTDTAKTTGKHTPRKSRPAANRPAGRNMLFLLLFLTICIGVFLIWLYPVIMVGSEKEAVIRIPRNATAQNVYDSVSAQLGPDYAKRVIQLSKIRGADFSKRAGAYKIPEGENALSAMRRLTSGAQTPVRITINGFRNLELLEERISRKMEFPIDSLRAVLNDTAFMAQYGLRPEQALALFVDDTYEVYWTTSARETVAKIAENYRYLWNDARKLRARELGVSPVDMMIIASIADQETNNEKEKGVVGRLYINRLHNNMKLQADPTVRFALNDFTIQRISKNDLKVESPYNTYLHKGLPPGPIRTTGFKTVMSILNSEPHGYLYMCAKEDFSGTHNFATTYEEHLRNATRYQAALDMRGIKR
ncbi:MAG: endolytic transglycosylase MltG [Bacteroidales bacterium]|nr:endolytic transglycosylase MltG [Bacteroidales bacterium]